MLDRSVRRGPQHAVLGKGNEHEPLVFRGQAGRGILDCPQVQPALGSCQRGQLRRVHFENHRREAAQASPAVGEDQFLGVFACQLAHRRQQAGGDNPGLGHIHLVQNNDGIHPGDQRPKPVNQQALDRRRRRRPVLEIKPVQLARRVPGRDNQRLAVGEGATLGSADKMVQPDPALVFQGCAQLETLAVGSGKPQWINGANAQSGEVVHDGAAGARLGPDPDHIVNRQRGFNGPFLAGRVNLEVTVQAEVPHHRHAKRIVPRNQFLITGGVHGCDAASSRFSKLCINTTLSHWA